MGHGLHHAVVSVEGVFRQILAVAGGGDGGHVEGRMLVVQPLQRLPDQGHGVAQVGPVIREEEAGLLVNHRQLHGGGAGVDANVHRRGVVRAEGGPGHGSFGVAGPEGLVLLPALKQGRLAAVGLGNSPLLQPAADLVQVKLPVGVIGRPQGHKQQAVLGTDAGDPQRFVKALPQALGKGQRPPQIQDIPPDGPALGQARDGLVHHRLVDAGGDVLAPGPLVDEGLHVALGEHAAPGGDGVGLLRFGRGLVHLVGGHFQKGGHLVDEGPGAAGAGAVHPHLDAAGEEEDLGVLAPQLNDAVRARGQTVRGHPGGEDLLHKGDLHSLRHAHAGGAGDGKLRPAAGDVLPRHPAQQLPGLLQNMAEMPLVCTVCNVSGVVQHHAFDGGGTHVKTHFQGWFLL